MFILSDPDCTDSARDREFWVKLSLYPIYHYPNKFRMISGGQYHNTTIYILQSTVVFEYIISSIADVGDYELRRILLTIWCAQL